MTSRFELLNKIARLARLTDDQIRVLALEFDARITRFLSRRRQYVYVAFVIPLGPEGMPMWDKAKKHAAVYEAKKESVVYRAGQQKFGLMNTTEQVFVDNVLCLEE